MSVEAGGSIENLMEGINTSNESISSIIPFEKREELSRFEMTLKQMIEEAKQMAAKLYQVLRKSSDQNPTYLLSFNEFLMTG